MGTQSSDGTVQSGAFRNWLTVDVRATAYTESSRSFARIVMIQGSRVFTRSIGTTGGLLNEADIQTVISNPDFGQLLAFTAPQAVL